MTGQQFTPAEAAALLRPVTENWLREHIRDLPHLRIGRRIAFTDEHIEQIRRQHEHQPTPAAPELLADVDLAPLGRARRKAS